MNSEDMINMKPVLIFPNLLQSNVECDVSQWVIQGIIALQSAQSIHLTNSQPDHLMDDAESGEEWRNINPNKLRN